MNKYIVSREPREVMLNIQNEDGTKDEIKLKIRDVPWSRHNQIISLNLKWDDKGNTSFDSDTYIREMLKYMIVEAPWGETSDVFLSQINRALGDELMKLVPQAFGKRGAFDEQTLKKG